MMKSKEIRELISFIAESGLAEVSIETEEIKLHIKRAAGAVEILSSPLPTLAVAPHTAPAVRETPPVAENTGPAKTPAAAPETSYVTLRSPMIGTFYRSPNPDTDSFVNVGDTVSKGDPVCIIEAMKLFNEIESDFSGKIVKVLVENASPVEYDQPLFLIDPS